MRPAPDAQRKTSTTKLPAALREELGIAEPAPATRHAGGGGGGSSSSSGPLQVRGNGRIQQQGNKRGALGRKDARRAKRQDAKSARAVHHQTNRHRDQGRDEGAGAKRAQSKTLRPGEPQAVAAKTAPSSAPKVAQRPAVSAKGKGKASNGFDPTQDERGPSREEHTKHATDSTKTPLQRMLEKSQGSHAPSGTESGRNEFTKRKRAGPKAPLSTMEQNEEDEIAWLEAQLGSSGKAKRPSEDSKVKKKRKTASDEIEADGIGQDDDGLDDLLGDLDHFYPGMYDEHDGSDGETSDHSSSESGRVIDDGLSDLDQGSSDIDGTDYSSELRSSGDEEIVDKESDDEAKEIQGAEGKTSRAKLAFSPLTDKLEEDEGQRSATGVPKESSGTARYVPPALRRQSSETEDRNSEEDLKVRRQVKGLLNRLGENNVEVIVGEIESLFRQFSRANVTDSLTRLVIDTIKAGDNVADTFVILYGTLVASLHRIIGVEFGAHFVQATIEEFTRLLDSAHQLAQTEESQQGKECRNLAALIAVLYSIGVVACPLVYDLVKLLLGVDEQKDKPKERRTMTELDVDVLLRIAKLCGQQLRHDDAGSLKAIVQLAREQLAYNASTRAKFMMDNLQDLSNNRSRSTTASVGQEQLVKMRKFIGGLGKRRTLRTHEAIRVTLKDLRNADKRGRWWLVGAAWAGYDFGDSQQDAVRPLSEKTTSAKHSKGEDAQTEELMVLARTHGMNTALRQQIFVTVLSSQDYLDAVQRLLALTHRNVKQRREIVRVLLHCIAREPTFNPYYVVIGTRLAHEDEVGTRITMQYCLWDYLRLLGEKSVGGRSVLERGVDEDDDNKDVDDYTFGAEGGSAQDKTTRAGNTARTYGWWMSRRAVGLEALRPVDFTALKPRGRRFLQLLLVHVLLAVQASSPAQMLTLPKTSARDGSSSIGVASQARGISLPDAATSAIETLFVQGTRANHRIAQGLVVFFEQNLRPRDCTQLATSVLGVDKTTMARLLAAREVAVETVRVGSQVAARSTDDFDADDGFM